MQTDPHDDRRPPLRSRRLRCALGDRGRLCAFRLRLQYRSARSPARPTFRADYRLRHPITLQEADHTMELFIGTNRGELNPTQRAQVLSFGLGWKREATGGIVVDRAGRQPQ